MKSSLKPVSKTGKWSVGLQSAFVIITAVSLLLVASKVISFDSETTFSFLGESSLTWWDATVFILSILSPAALITGLIALLVSKDRSAAVFISVIIGVCTILFLLLHSLFIND